MKQTICILGLFVFALSLFSQESVDSLDITALDTLGVVVESDAIMDAEPFDSISYYLAQGDSFQDAWQNQQAAETFLKVIRMDSTHYTALWKGADAITDYADHLSDDEKSLKESLFHKADSLCDMAIRIYPEGWEGYAYKSLALGRLALFFGGKKKINMSKQIKSTVDRALELNPDSDMAQHILGRWHQNLANLSWVLRAFAKILYGGAPPGSNETAVACFQRAIEIAPNRIVHHFELARTYKFMGKKDLARSALDRVLSLPATEQDDLEKQDEAREMVEDL